MAAERGDCLADVWLGASKDEAGEPEDVSVHASSVRHATDNGRSTLFFELLRQLRGRIFSVHFDVTFESALKSND